MLLRSPKSFLLVVRRIGDWGQEGSGQASIRGTCSSPGYWPNVATLQLSNPLLSSPRQARLGCFPPSPVSCGPKPQEGSSRGTSPLPAPRPVASPGLQPQALVQAPQNSRQTQRDSGAGARGEGAAPRQEHLENELTPKSGVHLDKVMGLEGC